jgi:hypothetical protein
MAACHSYSGDVPTLHSKWLFDEDDIHTHCHVLFQNVVVKILLQACRCLLKGCFTFLIISSVKWPQSRFTRMKSFFFGVPTCHVLHNNGSENHAMSSFPKPKSVYGVWVHVLWPFLESWPHFYNKNTTVNIIVTCNSPQTIYV